MSWKECKPGIGYSICARWPKSVDKASHGWESWTNRLPSREIALAAHKRLISKGADTRYEFGLFHSVKIGQPFSLIRRL